MPTCSIKRAGIDLHYGDKSSGIWGDLDDGGSVACTSSTPSEDGDGAPPLDEVVFRQPSELEEGCSAQNAKQLTAWPEIMKSSDVEGEEGDTLSTAAGAEEEASPHESAHRRRTASSILRGRLRWGGRSSEGGRAATRPGQRGPTAEEAELAARWTPDVPPAGGPAFYAVEASWFSAWRAFAMDEVSQPPGPIVNTPLLSAEQDDRCEAEIVRWVCADDWQLLHTTHGGGPTICRAVCALSYCGATSGSSTDTAELEGLVCRTAASHASHCRWLGERLAAQVSSLEQGAWTKKRARSASHKVQAARRRVSEAVRMGYGGEELRAALEALRSTKSQRCLLSPSILVSLLVDRHRQDEGLHALDCLTAELCFHEEAQLVLVCLLQALKHSEINSIELWLEQARSMNLEVQAVEMPLMMEPLWRHLEELRTRPPPRGASWDSSSASEDDERDELRGWQQNRNNVAQLDGEDVGPTLEELKELAKSVGAFRDGAEPADDAADAAPGIGGKGGATRTQWNDPYSWCNFGSGDWRDPTKWNSTEDFITAYRRLKHQERTQGLEREESERQWHKEEMERECEQQFERLREEWQRQEAKREREKQAEEEWRSQQRRHKPPPGEGGVAKALATLRLPSAHVPPFEELKIAYRKAALRAHPDRPHNRGRQREATAEFQQVKEAFDLLAPDAG